MSVYAVFDQRASSPDIHGPRRVWYGQVCPRHLTFIGGLSVHRFVFYMGPLHAIALSVIICSFSLLGGILQRVGC